MRKITAAFILMLLAMSFLSATGWEGTSTHGDLSFTAYKELPLPALFGFEINVSNAKDDDVVGSAGEYRVEQADLGSTGTLFGNGLTVAVGTNSRTSLTVGLWFSPFQATINNDIVNMPVTWTITTEPDTTWCDELQYGDHYYRYYLDYSFKDAAKDPVPSVSTAKIGVNAFLVFTPVAQRRPVTGGDWEDIGLSQLPDSGSVLPGFTQENGDGKIRASATFSLTLSTAYNKLVDNVRYTGNIMVTVEGN